MTTSEERLKILEMIREGKLNPEEGARLLQALQASAKKQNERRADPRWLRVRVTDMKTGKNQVSVNLPMSLVSVGIKMGARFVPRDSNFDYGSIMEAIKSGQMGKVADFENEGERVEIWVE
jgi:hypothetical protein